MAEAVAEKKTGMKWIKILGIITLVGVLVAVGRIVLRVFREESRRPDDAHSGV